MDNGSKIECCNDCTSWAPNVVGPLSLMIEVKRSTHEKKKANFNLDISTT